MLAYLSKNLCPVAKSLTISSYQQHNKCFADLALHLQWILKRSSAEYLLFTLYTLLTLTSQVPIQCSPIPPSSPQPSPFLDVLLLQKVPTYYRFGFRHSENSILPQSLNL